jgi:hypothetical protein
MRGLSGGAGWQFSATIDFGWGNPRLAAQRELLFNAKTQRTRRRKEEAGAAILTG